MHYYLLRITDESYESTGINIISDAEGNENCSLYVICVIVANETQQQQGNGNINFINMSAKYLAVYFQFSRHMLLFNTFSQKFPSQMKSRLSSSVWQ